MKGKKIAHFFIGYITILAIACFVINPINKMITNKMYKKNIKNQHKDDENDWGPVIVKKSEDK